ncbi:hypothetical protein [Candidatus Leptofilum sp.]|uniref:hypothetical protein n=1 Tax=Candidatus Leptofilum sp. TaxID=3241576 RepID=UPI003B5CCC49
MIVQWVIKGIDGSMPSGIDRQQAIYIANTSGILSNWFRAYSSIPIDQFDTKLTRANLDHHVNNYAQVRSETPFISLTAGNVERDAYTQTNRILPAKRIALEFATSNGQHPGFLFFCWVIAGLKPAVRVEGLSEQVRDLTTYQRYSPYQLEGEITAKIRIPSNQIQRVEQYDPEVGFSQPTWQYQNIGFTTPDTVSNLREFII